MRRGLLIFLLGSILLLGLLVRSLSTLLRLLLEDGMEDVIGRAELAMPNANANASVLDTRPALIPKIIHQTYINDSIPARWQAARQSCLDLHHDYEYRLWTDDKARAFIAAEYDWFLPTFDGYGQPIQRADAIRYFVLARYGGVYIDLDDGCNRRLDPLLAYPAWLRSTVPTGISNDVMGSVPQHPFFLRVIGSLQRYDRRWYLPYITVMYSTGPLFLSVIWKEYTRDLGRARAGSEAGAGAGAANDANGAHRRVRVLMPDEYRHSAASFFTVHVGNSWHGQDARLIFWMGRHWLFLTALGTVVVCSAALVTWWSSRRLLFTGIAIILRRRPTRRHRHHRTPGRPRRDSADNNILLPVLLRSPASSVSPAASLSSSSLSAPASASASASWFRRSSSQPEDGGRDHHRSGGGGSGVLDRQVSSNC